MGTPSCSLGVSLQCYECLRLCSRAPIACRQVVFFFFNITGGVCWAGLFGFGAYAVGAEIYKISGTLSVISLGLFIAVGYALSIYIRRNEVALRRRAEAALPNHSCR